ncbi:hypothetical protein FT663_01472 [Candidozyma haemuli var. vulneris]|uniref:Histone-lysine N-methyltransferase, H3 lysine-36 specific n=1 Tax=Candidozyma haemuli TaxID=45357 RepID=A0A2V1AP79_9ASCO|nr:hypothetical protein CXQ85_003497 [[Candida] haemuloni]KAF3991601.1 hypothetical protein FT662_01599 [[Candida] haemuloni var. vulneris]KAF3994453.1 hypothetical protein FT663_01472 [[Candida] haemuloni var. vulneris]PVH19648.1 hypothetical protein CXQ85_003497 [[Candida] haemuloni]
MSKESTPALFKDAEDKTQEAKGKFSEIAECSYLSKSLGSIGSKELMACDCTEDWDHEKEMNMACGENSHCINRVTSVECTNKSCFCGKDCQNQRFQKKQYCEVKVIQTEKKGYGLVAEQTISEGSFVYEYIGEVVDEETFRKRMIDYDTRKLRHFYFMMLTKDAFIDATDKGSLARFCNHSCSPNAYVDKWVVGDKLRMGIFAKREILDGEEITFDYNVDRYGAQSQPCYCGAPNCLGWMGGKTQTDAALLLPEGISEALGVTRAQEKAWLKRNKQARVAQQEPDATINEDFVKSLDVEALNEHDVNKAMAALMKAEDSNIVSKIIDRVYLTEDAKLNSIIVRLHGYKTLSQILKENSEVDELTRKVLSILRRWPSMTRNKIESSQIEDVVKKIVSNTDNSEIRELGSDLLADWSKLEMAYRIPKNRDGSAKTEKVARGSMSPLYGRTVRSASPTWGYEDVTEPTTNDSPPSEAPDDDELPPGWQKAVDPNTNTVYYYHSELGISKWERPTIAVPKGPSIPKGPKQKQNKQQKQQEQQSKQKQKNGKPNQREGDYSSVEESKLQKLKEEQFNEMRQREKLLQDLIVQSQQEAEEKKRLAEQAKKDKLDKLKQRRKQKELAWAKSRTPPVKDESVEVLWTRTLARYIPNMVKKHEAEIGHENVKGCARDLVKILASKEAKKETAPPKELDNAKLKKLKEFTGSFMEKFLIKFRSKRPRTDNNSSNGQKDKTTTT